LSEREFATKRKRKKYVDKHRVLHADNGSALKAATLLEAFGDMDIERSTGRASATTTPTYWEELFRACKFEAIPREIAAEKRKQFMKHSGHSGS
jgi:hypothetical protein